MNQAIEFQRAQMISQQVRSWYVLDQQVLRVMSSVPRELFLPDNLRNLAFADTSIPLGNGQQTLAPKVEGRVLQALELDPADSVLMVGVGSGYLAACIAKMAKQIRCIEPLPEVAAEASKNLLAAVINNVSIEVGNAAELNISNTYNAVVIGGSLPVYDERFERMLKPGGRLVMITGVSPVMQVVKVTRLSANQWHRETLFETADIPPLAGATKPPAFVF